MQRRCVELEVLGDIACPWCCIAKRRLDRAISLLPDVAVTVRWVPYAWDKNASKDGVNKREYYEGVLGAAKLKSLLPNTMQAFEEEGLSYTLDGLTGCTLDCHRLLAWAGEQYGGVLQGALLGVMYEMYHCEGKFLGCTPEGHANTADAAARAGLPRDAALGVLRDAAAHRMHVEADMAAHRAAGITSIPRVSADNGRVVLHGAKSVEEYVAALRNLAHEAAAAAAAAEAAEARPSRRSRPDLSITPPEQLGHYTSAPLPSNPSSGGGTPHHALTPALTFPRRERSVSRALAPSMERLDSATQLLHLHHQLGVIGPHARTSRGGDAASSRFHASPARLSGRFSGVIVLGSEGMRTSGSGRDEGSAAATEHGAQRSTSLGRLQAMRNSCNGGLVSTLPRRGLSQPDGGSPGAPSTAPHSRAESGTVPLLGPRPPSQQPPPQHLGSSSLSGAPVTAAVGGPPVRLSSSGLPASGGPCAAAVAQAGGALQPTPWVSLEAPMHLMTAARLGAQHLHHHHHHHQQQQQQQLQRAQLEAVTEQTAAAGAKQEGRFKLLPPVLRRFLRSGTD